MSLLQAGLRDKRTDGLPETSRLSHSRARTTRPEENGCSAIYGGASHQPADRQISAQKLYFVLTQRPRALTSQLASCPLRRRTAASPLDCATLQHRSTDITVFLPIAWFCHLARGTIQQFQEVRPVEPFVGAKCDTEARQCEHQQSQANHLRCQSL